MTWYDDWLAELDQDIADRQAQMEAEAVTLGYPSVEDYERDVTRPDPIEEMGKDEVDEVDEQGKLLDVLEKEYFLGTITKAEILTLALDNFTDMVDAGQIEVLALRELLWTLKQERYALGTHTCSRCGVRTEPQHDMCVWCWTQTEEAE